MHSPTSNMRRSRLNPITYSRCCHRPSSPRRLATLVLPLIAPTDRVGERAAPAGRSRPARGPCRRRPAPGARPAGGGDAAVEGGRFAAVGLLDHPDVGQAEVPHDAGGVVGRAVVDHDHLDLRVVARDQGPDGRGDVGRLVVGRHDHRDRAEVAPASTGATGPGGPGSGPRSPGSPSRSTARPMATASSTVITRASQPLARWASASASPRIWSALRRLGIARRQPQPSETVRNWNPCGLELGEQAVDRGHGVAPGPRRRRAAARRRCRPRAAWPRRPWRRPRVAPSPGSWSASTTREVSAGHARAARSRLVAR